MEVIPVRRFRTDVAFTIHVDGLPTTAKWK